MAACFADPAKVVDNLSTISLKLPALRSALDIPTPNFDKAVLLPRYALLRADVTDSKSLPVDADMSNESCNSFCDSAELRVATAKR